MSFRIILPFVLLFILLPDSPLAAQQKYYVVVPGPEYEKGLIHNIFFGIHHRKTWTSPVQIPSLNLSQAGFKPLKRGGSRETSNLRIADKEGREWVIRSVNKDLSNAVAEKYRNPLFTAVLRDMASANHPYAPLVVARLAKTARIIHATPRLYVLENDPILGEYKEEFAGMMVMLEERPDESWKNDDLFLKADKVIGTEDMIEKLGKKKTACFNDTLYLRCRLLDILVGDWSRHADQYRWLELDGGDKCERYYLPVPRDRDHAFYRNDGLINSATTLFLPKLASFDKKLNQVKGLTAVGIKLDSLVLGRTGKELYIAIAREFQQTMTDEVIAEALNQLPLYPRREKDMNRWDGALKARRDQLVEAAEEFYELVQKKASPRNPSH